MDRAGKQVDAMQVADLPPQEWAPFIPAFTHVKRLVGPAKAAALVLTKNFRDGRLFMGVRWIIQEERDATGVPRDICFVYTRHFWERARIEDRGRTAIRAS
jgi:hypothetical protein